MDRAVGYYRQGKSGCHHPHAQRVRLAQPPCGKRTSGRPRRAATRGRQSPVVGCLPSSSTHLVGERSEVLFDRRGNCIDWQPSTRASAGPRFRRRCFFPRIAPRDLPFEWRGHQRPMHTLKEPQAQRDRSLGLKKPANRVASHPPDAAVRTNYGAPSIFLFSKYRLGRGQPCVNAEVSYTCNLSHHDTKKSLPSLSHLTRGAKTPKAL